MEKEIRMSFAEYEALKNENRTLKAALEEKENVIIESEYLFHNNGQPVYRYLIYTESQVIKLLQKHIDSLESKVAKLEYERQQSSKKKWYQF